MPRGCKGLSIDIAPQGMMQVRAQIINPQSAPQNVFMPIYNSHSDPENMARACGSMSIDSLLMRYNTIINAGVVMIS